MTHKPLLEMLTRQGLAFIVIGGTAIRLYKKGSVPTILGILA